MTLLTCNTLILLLTMYNFLQILPDHVGFTMNSEACVAVYLEEKPSKT